MVTSARHRKLSLLYFRYKDSPYYIGSVIFVIFLTSLLLLLKVIIPQITDLISINNEINSTRERLTNLKRNITYLNTLNNATLDADLALTFSALPSDKDFASIISAINRSAIDSGVVVNDYSLVIGELATSSARLNKFSSVDLSLTVQGSEDMSKTFMKRIYEILPLSQITTVSLTERDATLRISFYIKSFPQGSYDVVEQIKQIPTSDAAVFNSLAAWRIDQTSSLTEDNVPAPELEIIGPPF